jgi:hypothetical protein
MSNLIGIYAHARSGSTSVQRVVQSHSKISKLIYEPLLLHRKWKELPDDHPFYYPRDTKEQRMKLVRDWIKLENSSGFKHLAYSVDLDPMSYTNELLEEFFNFKSICIYRENISQVVLSCMMSAHTGFWHSWHIQEHGEKMINSDLELNLDEFEFHFNNFKKTQEIIKSINGCFHLVYENFFYQSMNKKKKVVSEMFEFLGYEPEFNDKTEEFLSSNSKFNNRKTYQMVKNIDEIHRKFGGIF